MQTLRFGDRGLFVRYLQAALLRAGEEPGEIDGIFGRRTERALIRLQERYGVRSDGVADRLTWAALWPYFVGSEFRTDRDGKTNAAPLDCDVVFPDLPYSAFLTACVLEGFCSGIRSLPNTASAEACRDAGSRRSASARDPCASA